MFQTKFHKILKDTFFCALNIFRKSCCLRGNVENCSRARQATGDNMALALCVLDSQDYWLTLIICNTYCFSTAIMVTRTRLNVTFIRTDGRTVRHTHGGTNSRFSQFCERAWKLIVFNALQTFGCSQVRAVVDVVIELHWSAGTASRAGCIAGKMCWILYLD